MVQVVQEADGTQRRQKIKPPMGGFIFYCDIL